MRLHGITLANFRSISDRIEVPIGRITYLIGPNGAGKSNVLEGVQKIADMIVEGRHVPKPDEYFDSNDDNRMELGATFELSDREHLRFLKHRAGLTAVSNRDLGPNLPFRFLKYVAAPDYESHRSDEIWMSTSGGKLEQFVHAMHVGSTSTLAQRDVKKSTGGSPLPPMSFTPLDKPIPLTDLFSLLDPFLLTSIQLVLNNIKVIETDRSIPAAVPARESHEVSPTGKNLPNELNDLLRSEQNAFDELMARVTRGDPTGIEPRAAGSDLVLEVHEKGLTRKARHTDLSSGQLQTLILVWQVFQRGNAIVVLKEPEMHLHAERQKQVLRMIRQKSAKDGTQFIIETHSAVFLGTGKDESVLLATKSEGRTRVASIPPENMRMIREELGISHADAMYNTRVVFVEGKSEFAAFPIFWTALHPDIGPAPAFFSLDGAGNTKHLQLMLEYLKADDRRFFAVLDRHEYALDHIKELQPDLLPADGLHILKKSFEDEFTSEQIARAACGLAKKAGFDLDVAPEVLDAARRDGGMIKTIKERWNKSTGAPFNKADLAEALARLCGRDEIPAGIRAALGAAAASLGYSDDSGHDEVPLQAARGGKRGADLTRRTDPPAGPARRR